MSLDRKTREELAALSLEVYGSSSRYKKFMESGYAELLTEEKKEVVKGVDGAPDTEKTVKVPIRRADGALQSVTKYHTVDSIRELMLERRAAIEKIQALRREMEEKKKQEELNKKVQEHAGGSAL